MMDDFFNGFDEWRTCCNEGGWQGSAPVIDIAETEKEMVITAEMPGLDEKDFEITVSGDLLTIKGEKKVEHEEKNGNGYHRERRYGAFSRSLRLPIEVKDEQIDATYQKGSADNSLAKTGGRPKGGSPD